jgi:hypothetical protein
MKKKISPQEEILIFLWRTYGSDEVDVSELTHGAQKLRQTLRNLILYPDTKCLETELYETDDRI